MSIIFTKSDISENELFSGFYDPPASTRNVIISISHAKQRAAYYKTEWAPYPFPFSLEEYKHDREPIFCYNPAPYLFLGEKEKRKFWWHMFDNPNLNRFLLIEKPTLFTSLNKTIKLEKGIWKVTKE